MNRFLVTGLPRSRTAWMAAACCLAPDAFCRHEPSAGLVRGHDFADLWKIDGYAHVGVSDSLLSLHLSRLLAAMPDLRVLVIDRDLDEVDASLMDVGLPSTKLPAIMKRRLKAFRHHRNVRWVRFEDLNDEVETCLAHLMPGTVIDRAKIASFLDLHIKVSVADAIAKAEARAADVDFLLGPDVVEELRRAA